MYIKEKKISKREKSNRPKKLENDRRTIVIDDIYLYRALKITFV